MIADIVGVALLGATLVVVALWARSYAAYDFYGGYLREKPPPGVERGYWYAGSSRGMLVFAFSDGAWGHTGHYPRPGYRRYTTPLAGPFGFRVSSPDDARTPIWGVNFPHAALALPLSLLPAARFGAWWRRRAGRGAGACAVCGYDLRATPERCPECGMEAVPSPSHNQPLQRTGRGRLR